jgi:6-phosphogluconolactonase
VKLLIFFLSLLIFSGCKNQRSDNQEATGAFSFFVGTYTSDDSQGIYKYQLDKNGKLSKVDLFAKSENPSYLAISPDKKYLLTVNETNTNDGNGTVESYKIYNDSLAFISRSSSGGAHPCYVSLNKKSYVITANYSGGNLGLLRLNEIGMLSELLDIQQHSGAGTTGRQKGPHAQTAMFYGDGLDIIAADLGTNEVWFSRLDETKGEIIPVFPHKLKMKAGAGPRHIAIHPDGKLIYVINELDNTVSLLKQDENGKYQVKTSFSTLPEGYEGDSFCADIHISSDGKYLYASNRGHNSIAAFKIIPISGILKHIGFYTDEISWPRSFSLSPDEEYLVVANQKSGYITSYKRDKETGELEFVDIIEAPDPVCIKFLY